MFQAMGRYTRHKAAIPPPSKSGHHMLFGVTLNYHRLSRRFQSPKCTKARQDTNATTTHAIKVQRQNCALYNTMSARDICTLSLHSEVTTDQFKRCGEIKTSAKYSSQIEQIHFSSIKIPLVSVIHSIMIPFPIPFIRKN